MSVDIFQGIDPKLIEKFRDYHLAHPEVFDQFYELANEMKSAGRKKYSAWSIINRIRWDHDLNFENEPFQINNDFIALYARLLVAVEPDFEGFFEMRRMKPEDRRESAEERYRRKTAA